MYLKNTSTEVSHVRMKQPGKPIFFVEDITGMFEWQSGLDMS